MSSVRITFNIFIYGTISLKGLREGHFDPPHVFLDNSETSGNLSTKF